MPSGPSNVKSRDVESTSFRLTWQAPKLRRNQLLSDLDDLTYKLYCFICETQNRCDKPCEGHESEVWPWMEKGRREISSSPTSLVRRATPYTRIPHLKTNPLFHIKCDFYTLSRISVCYYCQVSRLAAFTHYKIRIQAVNSVTKLALESGYRGKTWTDVSVWTREGGK